MTWNICSDIIKTDKNVRSNDLLEAYLERGGSLMKITRSNLNEVLFENQDARLLIEDVVSHTQADLYYYHDVEITLQTALKIWNKANEAEKNERVYRVSFLDFALEQRELIGLRAKMTRCAVL